MKLNLTEPSFPRHHQTPIELTRIKDSPKKLYFPCDRKPQDRSDRSDRISTTISPLCPYTVHVLKRDYLVGGEYQVHASIVRIRGNP